jgi:hypothetical protein
MDSPKDGGGDCQKGYRNGDHQGDGNEAYRNLPGWTGQLTVIFSSITTTICHIYTFYLLMMGC